MRKRLSILLAIIAVSIIVILALRNSSDPVYHGIRLSDWLDGYNRFSTNSVPVRRANREKANEAVRALGTRAIPRLLSMLQARDSDLKNRLIDLLQKQHIIKVPPPQVEDGYYEAEQAFAVLGASAGTAVPKLIKIYGVNRSLESQTAILNSLGYIGPAARGAIPFLLREAANTNNTNIVVRADSIMALGRIHSEPEIVVPALTRFLHDPSPQVRVYAINSLGEFGKDAQSATTEILELLKGQDYRMRDKAVYLLCQLYAETGSRPTASSDAKSREYASTLTDVITALEALGTNARPTIPMLVKFLSYPDESVRARATTALKAIDPEQAIKEKK